VNWLYYLLEANLYLAVFYAFYRLFLHQETFYTLNRYYLITATVFSFILPFLQVGYLNNLFSATQENMMVVTSVVYQKRAAPATFGYFELSGFLFTIYLVITLGFLVKMLFTLTRIFSIYFKSSRRKIDKITLIELRDQHAAFSFFNILFIHPDLKEKDTVLKHEMVHVTQKHSADVIFFEVVQIISWFNPIVYFLKQDIKLLHEYIADEQTTTSGIQKHDYALFLIQHSFGPIPNKLSNQIFNESLLKRRIKMLNKQKSGGLAKFRLLLLVPVATGLLCASTMAFTKDYAVDVYPQTIITQTPQDTGKIEKVVIGRPTTIFRTTGTYDKKAKIRRSDEKRAVVINGRVIMDNNNFSTVADYSSMKELSPANAVKKYGTKGTFGAVELSGPNTVVVQSLPAAPGVPPAPPALYKKLPGEKDQKIKNVIIMAPPANPRTPPTPPTPPLIGVTIMPKNNETTPLPEEDKTKTADQIKAVNQISLLPGNTLLRIRVPEASVKKENMIDPPTFSTQPAPPKSY